jgi:hypothetical protein
MKRFVCLGLLLMSMAGAQAAEFRNGQWVLAQWQGNVYWFPGVVQSTDGATVTILYDDGTAETRPANQVKSYDWHVGSTVECRWKAGQEWYRGRITSLSADGVTLGMVYDDGDREDTRTGYCRSR